MKLFRKPPYLIKWLLTKLMSHQLLEEFLGDMEELYGERLSSRGFIYAGFMYSFDALHLLLGFSSFKLYTAQNNMAMSRHYWTIALRNLNRNRVYALINVLSLAIGIGACLTILQYVYFELSYDKFHDNYENIYRVVIEETNSNAHETYPDGIGYSFGVAATNEIPEVLHFVRKGRVNRTAAVTNLINNNVFYEDVNNLLYVDPTFFEVFNFPLLTGKRSSLFDDKFSIVITEKTAKKYFGEANPLGKSLRVSGPPSPGDYVVTGVLKDLPSNSHLQFDFLMPIDNYIEYGWGGAVKKQGGWTGFSVVTYLVLKGSVDVDKVRDKLNTLIARNTLSNEGPQITKKAILQPLADVYLKSNRFSYPGHFDATGSFQNIYIFSVISLFIILIAWINYINLATSQSFERAREVGIRKTLGAYRKQLIGQFLIESLMVNLLATGISIGLCYIFLPVMNQVTGKALQMTLIYLPEFWAWLMAMTLFGSFISGLYPSFILANFRPISAIRSQQASPTRLSVRKGLIVFQFLTSLALISATYLIYKQTTFMKNQELGLDLEKILILKGPRVVTNQESGIAKFKVFRDEMARHHSIAAVTGSLFVSGEFWNGGYRRLGTPESDTPHSRGFYTTLNFAETYGLDFIAGGPFTEDMSDERVLIINEAAVSTFGFKSPEDAIHQKLIGEDGDRTEMIVGVVKNFHWHSLHEGFKPYVISLYENRLTEHISIKVNTSDLVETVKLIEAGFHEFFPGNPFEFYFADEAFNRKYHAEDQFKNILLSFSVLAIIIACVGLFALVSHSFNLREKEIGIRKVLGAKVVSLMLLLSKEYLKLVLIAITLTIPCVWYLGSYWLNNYAYRINIGFDILLFPAFILLCIALMTVSRRTLLAAKANPIDSLRRE